MTNKTILLAALLLASCTPALANGLGESRSYQFRSDNQRQANLTVERTRLELLDLLGNGTGGGSGGTATGQTGNTTSVNVSGSNNVISITQTNNGAQSQTRDCNGASFNVTGGMFGC
ncbi:hypothetical protein SAMN05428969_1342 [Devosia sp. YR412]|uniref:hypothetical protein n=1 Tax=Devosia sp. YR412 TaxID=1881030 RepID=UPI0008B0905F|nr:hypothetical protein [Devosia sp. YR412]SEP97020.1 hypothetical protein SAMN05428969_1342 [Devosia sp. YR412]